MDNSWLSGGNSPGFIYYSLDETPSKNKSAVETSDFISFSENHNPSPQGSRFNPSSFSSPQNFRRGSPRNYKRGWKQHSNMSHSPNTSNNYSSNNSRSGTRDSSFYSFKSRNNSFHKSSYIHPSFLEDPWATLQKQLEQKQRETVKSCDLSNNNSLQKTEQTL